jgi:hypothetical protein
MTSITIGGPRETGPAVAEPAPLPTGGLVARAAGLLGEAADLPQPGYVTVSATQHISLQFAPDRSSFDALTGWALRFGGSPQQLGQTDRQRAHRQRRQLAVH